MRKPLISCIVPVFNRGEDLQVCVDSILQGGRNADIEIIIVDDASTDETPAVCEMLTGEYDTITIIHKQENDGVGSARDVGLSAAAGEYIFFVDSDDQVEPKVMQELLARNVDWQGVDIVGFNYVVEYAHARIPTTIFSPEGKTTVDELLERLHEYHPSNLWSYLFNRAFLLRNKVCMPHLRFSEDMVFVAQAILWANTMYIFPQYLYRYRDTSCNTENALTKTVNYTKQIQSLDAVQRFVLPITSRCNYTAAKKRMIGRLLHLRCAEVVSKSTMDEFRQLLLSNIHHDSLDHILASEGAAAAAAFYWKTIWNRLVERSNNFQSPVFMCPAGESAIGLAAKILSLGGRIDGFLDNGRKTPVSFHGYDQGISDRSVYPFELLSQIPTGQTPCIILFSVVDAAESIRKQLESMGFHAGREVICP